MFLATVLLGLMGHAGSALEIKNDAGSPKSPPLLDQAEIAGLWQEQMHTAWNALHEKNWQQAEQICLEALATAGQFGPGDGHLVTNFDFLAEIYQSENKSEAAEKAFKSALACGEKTFGPNAPDLVVPLEKLANFYYFVERRYDLATPLCLKILAIMEASPHDDIDLIKRFRAVAVLYRTQDRFDQAEQYYQQTLALAAHDTQILPDCLLNVAGFYHDWGKYDQAETLCKRALALREASAESNPGQESQMNLAISLYGLAEIYRGWGKLESAEQFYRRSENIVENCAGKDSPEQARPLAGLAKTLASQGKINEAVKLYARAFAVTQDGLEPGDPAVEDIIRDYTTLLSGVGRSSEAKILCQNYQWRVLMHGSSRALRLNDLSTARQLAVEALDTAKTFGSDDVRLSQSEIQMAEVYRQQGSNSMAECAYKDAITSCESAVGTNSSALILPLQSLANFYYYTDVRYDNVASLYHRILGIVQTSAASEAGETAVWERNLGDVYRLQNQNQRALDCYQKAVAATESSTNVPAADRVQYLLALGDFERACGDYEHAEAVLKLALDIRQKVLSASTTPDAQLDVALCCDFLGQNYLSWNKPVQAESFYRRSLAIVEKVDGTNSAEVAARLNGLGAALRGQKQYVEAEEAYKRELTIIRRASGPDSPAVAEVLDQYAALLVEMNKTGDAKNMHDWATSLRKENEAGAN
jgi:tetratricopeptide (TPR) repeat protein